MKQNYRWQSSHWILLAWVLIGCLVTYQPLYGQTKEGDVANSEFALHAGRLLPAHIEGVSEVMPFWGFRHSVAQSSRSYIEWGVMTARAYATDWTTLSVSLRGDVPIEYMSGIFYAGIDSHLYNPAQQVEQRNENGLHVGTGLLNHFAENLWFRADMKFNFGPGSQMYLGFSLVFKEP